MKEIILDNNIVNGGLDPILFECPDLEYFYAFPPLTSNHYTEIINSILEIPELHTSNVLSRDHMEYTLRHKIAIMALSYEFLGYVSKRIMLHDTEKLALYSIVDTKEGRNLHVKHSIHHHGNFNHFVDQDVKNDFYIDNLMEAILDYECARYTKPDKPLNAYQTIMKYFPDDYEYSKKLLVRFWLNFPESKDCKFEKWNSVSYLYMPLFKHLTLCTIKELKTKLLKDTDHCLSDYNQYIQNLHILKPNL